MSETNATRTALLDLAEDLLQRQSFANVSFQALAKGVGIKKGSVYYHFESKEELGEAILERTAQQLRDGFKAIQGEPIAKQLHVYTNWFAKHIGASEKLCPGAAFAASWDSEASGIHARVHQLYQVHRKGLTDIIRTGQQSGDFPAQQHAPERLADIAFCTLQGGLLAARVSQDPQLFFNCKQQVLDMIKTG